MLNTISLMGRLTRDPELRQTGSGKPVCNFSLAVDRDFKNPDGDKETDFIDIVTWNKTAEFVSKYLRKGSLAIATGRLQMRSWTDKDGKNRISAEVVADSVYFGERRKDNPSTEPIDLSKIDLSAADGFAALEESDDALPFQG